jgi:hypothetical protein
MTTLGALQALEVGGRTVLAASLCDPAGHSRLELRDGGTGDLLAATEPSYKPWWFDPKGRSTVFLAHDVPYLVHVDPRGWGYRVRRIRLTGFDGIGAISSIEENDHVTGVATAVLDGVPTVVTHNATSVRFRHWLDGHDVRPVWTAPQGWECAGAVGARDRLFVWLDARIADEVPADDRWRHAARLGGRLWDVGTDKPIGGPLALPGYRSGPWLLDGRPVMLVKVGWRDLQVWDVGRREALGPWIGNVPLARPEIGMLHGRPVLAGASGSTLAIWDIRTARLVAAAPLPRPPAAVTIGAGSSVWALDGADGFVRIEIEGARIHPAAVRRGLGIANSQRER